MLEVDFLTAVLLVLMATDVTGHLQGDEMVINCSTVNIIDSRDVAN